MGNCTVACDGIEWYIVADNCAPGSTCLMPASPGPYEGYQTQVPCAPG